MPWGRENVYFLRAPPGNFEHFPPSLRQPVPLSEVKKEYRVNPEADLVPVCPNCHAVVHHGGQLRTPDDVRKLLEAASAASSTCTGG